MQVHIRIKAALACILFLLASQSAAQDGRTTLVLDASGSMWGQIDGEAKITIAQRAISELIPSLAESTQIGLIAYGHRERGACRDIETLVPPGPDTAAEILEALATISPKGKTPLSDAVLFAAEGLRYTEERATVILISDGIETCDADPCAVGRELERAGVEFTAHVIGFDVDEAAKQQLTCLSEATGGAYVDAGDATELVAAIRQVAVAPPPSPSPVTFVAQIEDTKAPITSGLLWTVTALGEALVVLEDERDASPVLPLEPGDYMVTGVWIETEQAVSLSFEVAETGEPMTVRIAFDAPMPEATIEAPVSAPAGATVDVAWTGPEGEDDYLSVAEIGSTGAAYINTADLGAGPETALLMPIAPGSYEVRYISGEGNRILATAPIDTTAIEATLDAPATAEAGSMLDVAWSGPDYDGDYLTVAAPGSAGGAYINAEDVAGGTPVSIAMPSEAGEYELRYVAAQDNTPLASRTITVTAAAATLTAPDTAMAGSILQVTWTGPGNDGDFITVARGDQAPRSYVFSTDAETPTVALRMPSEPGTYELRYVLDEGDTVVTSRPITLTEPEATLDAPAQITLGTSRIEVEWTGPDGSGDYVSVAVPGAEDTDYERYKRTRDGSPLVLRMPDAAGRYELRYVMSDARRVIARRPIEVVEPNAQIAIPSSFPAGSALPVVFEGPRQPGDVIALVPAGGELQAAVAMIAAGAARAVTMELPDAPGAYEIIYVHKGDVLTRAPMTLR